MDLLKRLADNPELVLLPSKGQKHDFVRTLNKITKSLLDPLAPNHSVLDELHVNGLEPSQVYGQAKMILSGVDDYLLSEKIPLLAAALAEHAEGSDEGSDEGSEEESEQEFGDFDGLDDEALEKAPEALEALEAPEALEALDDTENEEELGEEFDDDEETKVGSPEPEQIKKDAFGLNDEFFDIDDFNKQILELEKDNNDNDNDDDDDDEEIDYFSELKDGDNSDEEEVDFYDEFFDKPGKRRTNKTIKKDPQNEDDDELGEFNEDEYDQAVDDAKLDLFPDEGEEDSKPKSKQQLSSFEKQQQKIQGEIAKLEAELVAEKKWTMKGEVRSGDRPRDSLLDDEEAPTLEFDRTSKPVPVITEEVTETIEDLIKRRVRNDEFDDLPKRLITDIGKFTQKQKAEVSEEKSAKSLAEIYEDEYHGVDPNEKISEQLQQAHDEISDLFTSLNYKLDSLSSAHYIPKPHEFKSIDIKVTDAPASIRMEDAQPLHVSEEATLAPQEVYKIGDEKGKGREEGGNNEVQLKSGLAYLKDELSSEEKQRLRRAKKRSKSSQMKQVNEMKDQKRKLQEQQGHKPEKKQKVDDAMGDLQRAKNVTVIDKKGQMRDALGNLKKAKGVLKGSDYRL